MSKSIRSNADVFASRGDPWVSEKEGLSGFGRNLRTENPELDQFTLARKAPIRAEPKSEPRKVVTVSQQRRLANILNRMHRDMKGLR